MKLHCLGVPILASNIRGHNEIVIPGTNGYFFDNINDLEKLIIQLYLDKEKLELLKNNARESVKKYILDNAFNEQIKIYEEVLQ